MPDFDLGEILFDNGHHYFEFTHIPQQDEAITSAHNLAWDGIHFQDHSRERGIEVIIAAAGGAAHLPGVLASWTIIPIIGVPLSTSELKGIDALYSIVQMPGGVPVASVGIGAGGVRNAALLAAQILGLKYDHIRKAFEKYRQRLAGGV